MPKAVELKKEFESPFRNVGQPRIFKDEKELQEALYKYFKKCYEMNEIPTIAGAAFEMGIDRHTFYNYEKKDEYFHTIKNAREYITSQLERKLVNSTCPTAGQIFIAKNYGYTDKQSIEHDVGGKLNKLLQDHFFND